MNSFTHISDRIINRKARLAIIGQGYVGLPLAVEFARAGFDVTGIDTDPARVESLNRGQSLTPDVAHADLQVLCAEGRYRATSDFAALERSEAVLICVPTPLRKSKDPDISFVAAAAEQVARWLPPGQLVILESTTYPGTTEELLLPMFEAQRGKAGTDFFLAFSPERIDPANPKFKVRDIPKVVGGVTPACSQLAALLYQQIVDKVMEVSSPKVAELSKLYENVFRNVNIALANELALICRHLDVNTREVIDAAATKPFGFLPFYPGPGIGGHCIGIDPTYLAWKVKMNGYDARFIHLAEEINQAMPTYVVQLLAEALNRKQLCLNGAKILVLGVAYKRSVGDTRESPALEIIEQLHKNGAQVQYADPYVPSVGMNGGRMQSVEVNDAVLKSVDCVLIITDHPDFDYRQISATASLVVDTRNATWGLPAAKAEIIRL